MFLFLLCSFLKSIVNLNYFLNYFTKFFKLIVLSNFIFYVFLKSIIEQVS
jgi:hypothetical protein